MHGVLDAGPCRACAQCALLSQGFNNKVCRGTAAGCSKSIDGAQVCACLGCCAPKSSEVGKPDSDSQKSDDWSGWDDSDLADGCPFPTTFYDAAFDNPPGGSTSSLAQGLADAEVEPLQENAFPVDTSYSQTTPR